MDEVGNRVGDNAASSRGLNPLFSILSYLRHPCPIVP